MLLIAITHHENLICYYLPGMADLLYIAEIYSDFIIKIPFNGSMPSQVPYLGKDKRQLMRTVCALKAPGKCWVLLTVFGYFLTPI